MIQISLEDLSADEPSESKIEVITEEDIQSDEKTTEEVVENNKFER